ncbi:MULTISPECIES: alpha/beta hydrolase [Lysinibacillus]|uniref:alpha/beta hydrolase n=1 Tax=Lysinibacillus TaxID=400634 RepID=UPI0021A6EE2F|nr:alpha/beta fold hydrolase [Lysinibacillus capsici]MCT1539902.1 alpha/beta fold hydrolase [Lysinibacillus capsici]MCT1571208.1 alpha/beta fold hydrolase [Lysinibacillus capsici]MCT1648375.1 alpha/beta fold hydrolase [Lysinibacillus capsici]MCT1726917.1 alpha/beta fold hydrolase [Lysinibacillus capsici]MCT1784552.1 alpha/beta fold hydrolase [Lysinibacillus capsici]
MSVGVLCIHGFSGGPYEVKPFTSYLRSHTGWIIEEPTLSGHGEELHMSGFKAKHWLMDAELAFRSLAKKVDEVIVVGFSMGGIIALYLAKRYKVKKLVLLSAAAKYVSPKQLVKDFKMLATEAYHHNLTNNELYLRYHQKFNNVPLASTVEFMKLVRMVEPYYRHIQIPVYIVQGKLDGIVPYHTAQFLFDELASTDKVLYFSDNGKHHICFEEDCSEWFPQVLMFLKGK